MDDLKVRWFRELKDEFDELHKLKNMLDAYDELLLKDEFDELKDKFDEWKLYRYALSHSYFACTCA